MKITGKLKGEGSKLEVIIISLALLIFSTVSPGADDNLLSGDWNTYSDILIYGEPGWIDSAPFAGGEELTRGDLSLYLKRANAEDTIEGWLNIVKTGLSFINKWEQEELNKFIQTRLVEWVTDGWGKFMPNPNIQGFLKEIERANLNYLYRTEEGKITLDKAGDPLLLGIEGLSGPGGDREKWEKQLALQKEELIRDWQSQADVVYDELIGELPENLKSELKEDMQVSFLKYRGMVEREFERLFRQSENHFLFSRLRDTYSLRKKAEALTAGTLAERLIKETETRLFSEKEILQGKIDSMADFQTEGKAIGGSDWEVDFRRAFESGMEEWNKAELRFLRERIRWEEQSQKAYIESEKAWDKAFALLGEARSDWIEEIKAIIKSGEKLWDKREGQYLEEYERTIFEINRGIEQESKRFEKEISGLLSMFEQGEKIANLAEKNIVFMEAEFKPVETEFLKNQEAIEELKKQIEEKERELSDYKEPVEENDSSVYIFNPFVTRPVYEETETSHISKEELEEEIARLKDELIARENSPVVERYYSLKSELDYWKEAMERYRKGALEAEKSILQLEEDPGPIISGYEQELNRRQQEVDLLEREVKVAEAVIRYAEDDSSDRPTEAETRSMYEEALDTFKKLESEYLNALNELTLLNVELQNSETDLDEKKKLLLGARDELERAKEEFQRKWEIWKVQDASVFYGLIEDYRGRIRNYYNSERGELFKEYYLAWERYSRDRMYGSAEELAQRYILGDESAGISALEELIEKSERISTVNIDWEAEEPGELFESRLRTAGAGDESLLFRLLLQAYEESMEGIGSKRTLSKVRAEYYLKMLKEEYSRKVFLQEEIVALLSPKKSPEGVLDGEGSGDGSGRPDPWIEELSLLLKKAQLEKEALETLEESYEGNSTEASLLAELLLSARGEAEVDEYRRYYIESLDGIIAVLQDLISGSKKVEEIERSPDLLSFLSGNDFFTQRGFNYADTFLTEDISRLEKVKEASGVYDFYSGLSPRYFSDLRGEKVSSLREFLDFDSSTGRSRRIEQIGSVAEAVEFYEGIYSLGELPGYLQETIDKCVSLALPGSTLENVQESEEISLRIGENKALEKFLLSRESILKKAAVLFSEGASGGESFLKDILALYLSERMREDSASPDKAEEYLYSLYEEAGLDSQPFSARELLEYEDNLSFENMDVEYVELLDGDVFEYVEEKYLPENLYEKTSIAMQIASKTGDGQSLRMDIHENYLVKVLESLKGENDDLERKVYALKKVEGLDSQTAQRDIKIEDGSGTFFISQSEQWSSFLRESIEVFAGSEWQRGGSYNEALLSLGKVNRSEKEAEELLLKMEQTERDLKSWEADREGYFEEVVVPAKKLIEELESKYRTAGDEYSIELNKMGAIMESFNLKREELKALYSNYKEAEYKLREAEEIMDYAMSAYRLESMNPYEVYDRRLTEYKKALKILNILQSLYNKGEEFLPTAERLDRDYLDLKQDQKITLERYNRFLSIGELLDRKVAEKREEVSTNFSKLESHIGTIIQVAGGEAFDPDFGAALHQLSIPPPSSIEDYLKSKEFSTHVCIWLSEMVKRGNVAEILKDYGYAYYYERQDSFLKGSMVWEINLELTKLSEEISFDVGAHANELSRNAYNRVQGDRMYQFFRLMMDEGLARFDTTYIAGDLNGNSVVAAKTEADKRINQLKQAGLIWAGVAATLKWIWPFGAIVAAGLSADRYTQADNLADLRDLIPAYSGLAGRKSIEENIGKYTELKDGYLRSKHELDLIIGSASDGRSLTADDLIRGLKEAMNGELGSGLESFIEEVFASLSEGDKRSNLTALAAISKIAKEKAEKLDLTVQRHASALLKQRDNLANEYNRLLSEKNIDWEAFTGTAKELFCNPSFSREDYLETELSVSGSVRNWNLQGKIDTLNDFGKKIISLYKYKLELSRKEQDEELARGLRELRMARDEWNVKTNELYSSGLSEWMEGFSALLTRRKRWKQEYLEDYGEKERMWNDKFRLFTLRKEQWIKESTMEAVKSAGNSIAEEIGLKTELFIGEIEGITIPDISMGVKDLSELVDSAVNGRNMKKLTESAEFLTKRLDEKRTAVSAFLPEVRINTGVLHKIAGFQSQLSDEIRRKAAMINAVEMKEIVHKTWDEILEKIEDANISVERGIASQLETAGFQASSDVFRRKVIIDNTLLQGKEWEYQQIEGYRHFDAPGFNIGVNLSRKALEQLSGEVIIARIKKARDNLFKYARMIFGGEKEQESFWNGLDSGFKDLVLNRRADFKASSRYKEYDDMDGLFNLHVGYIPVMKENKPEEVAQRGYGEKGRIFELFFIYEARHGRGIGKLDLPWYEQRLWDDDKDNDGSSDSFLRAPTFRSVADLGTSIVGNIVAPGQGFLLNLVSEGAFSVWDLENGRKNAVEVSLKLGKKAAIGLVSRGTGEVFGTISSHMDTLSPGIGKIVGKVLFKGSEMVARNMAGGIIDSIEYSDSEGLYFNDSNFEQRLIGLSSVGGYAGGLTREFTEDLLGDVVDGLYGSNDNLGELLKGGTELAAGLAGEAAKYGVYYADTARNVSNGDRSLIANRACQRMGGLVMNIADMGAVMDFVRAITVSGMNNYNPAEANEKGELIQRLGGQGLLELHLSDKGGYIQLGDGGINLAGNLYRLSKGLTLQASIRGYSHEEKMRDLLATAFGKGDRAAEETVLRLLSGKDTLYTGLLGARGKTVGDGEGGRQIWIEDFMENPSQILQAAVALQHESHRDGGQSADNYLETRRATLSHTEMAARLATQYGLSFLKGNSGLGLDLSAYYTAISRGNVGAFNDYVDNLYESAEDFWKLKVYSDGRHELLDDRSRDLTLEYWQIDEKGDSVALLGREVFADKTGRWSASIVNVLGIERVEEILGADLKDLDVYDEQTLLDVTGMNREQFRAMTSVGLGPQKLLSDEQWIRLAGEALLKSQGGRWDTNEGRWKGLEEMSLTLIDGITDGQIALDQSADGSIERFTITASLERKASSHYSWVNGRRDRKYEGQDSITFFKKNLDGSVLDNFTLEGLNTIDNMDGSNGWGTNAIYTNPIMGEVQADSLRAGKISFRLEDTGRINYQNWGIEQALLITGGRVMSGEEINWMGYAGDNNARHWVHSTRFGGSDGCVVTMDITDTEKTGVEQLLELNLKLERNWNIPSGYTIKGWLNDPMEWTYLYDGYLY